MTLFVPIGDFTPTQRARWTFHPFINVSLAFIQRYSVTLWSQSHSGHIINHLRHCRAWPIGQLRSVAAPEHAGQWHHKANKQASNRTAGKTRPKQAPTARRTHVFHHPHALAFPPANASTHTHSCRGRERAEGYEWHGERKMTRPRKPPRGPFHAGGQNKSILLPYCDVHASQLAQLQELTLTLATIVGPF